MSEVVKIVFYLKDGTKRYLDDREEIEKWYEFNKQVSLLAEIHNQNPDWNSIKWKKEGKDGKY